MSRYNINYCACVTGCPKFHDIRLWLLPEPFVSLTTWPKETRALGTRMAASNHLDTEDLLAHAYCTGLSPRDVHLDTYSLTHAHFPELSPRVANLVPRVLRLLGQRFGPRERLWDNGIFIPRIVGFRFYCACLDSWQNASGCFLRHSRSQRPRSFWSAPRIETSGRFQISSLRFADFRSFCAVSGFLQNGGPVNKPLWWISFTRGTRGRILDWKF